MPLKGKEKVLKRYDANADRFVRAFALDGMTRLIDKTPVKSGRAKNNWNLATGAPRVENIPEGEYSKSGSVALLAASSDAGKVVAGDTLFLTNCLPYIPALEDGHSKQAPAGMIGVTVVELRPLADRIVREVRRGDGS
jgi:hypothetical protein